MPNTQLKEKILAAAKGRLKEMEHDFKERLEELKAVTIGNENAESASQTESRRGSDLELMSSLADQLEHVHRDLELLDQIDPSDAHAMVTFGSVVHSDQRNFIISTGIEEFTVDGRDYLGLSPRAPLYTVLAEAKVGDKVEFNGVKYHLEEVF